MASADGRNSQCAGASASPLSSPPARLQKKSLGCETVKIGLNNPGSSAYTKSCLEKCRKDGAKNVLFSCF
jgi:N-acetylmuramic acid 6-phosphate (MurNAc-6-P) etherase